jgi:hypothetical protein
MESRKQNNVSAAVMSVSGRFENTTYQIQGYTVQFIPVWFCWLFIWKYEIDGGDEANDPRGSLI